MANPNLLDGLDVTKKTDLAKVWLKRANDALKREKKFREKAQRVVDIYEGKKSDETPFAIIYSNTETLQPALYNQRPIPIVTRRFKDADPLGKAAAETSTRLLKYLIDTESEDFDNFDELVQAANLDALLTNRGVTRFKFVPHGDYEECVYGEAVRWDKFFHGYARTWKKVPWIGFEWDMTEDEIKKNFPGVDVDFKNMAVIEADDDNNKAEDRDELEGVKLYKVYEIWDKVSKKVMFFSGCSVNSPLRIADDPLGLKGFFPVPRPLNFMKKVTTLIPTPLYEQYRQQAQELNEITRRLKALIKACRYRGIYNAAIEEIAKLLEADDNELIPVQNVQSMPDGTGMDQLIWTVPINEIAQAIQLLYQQREQCKQVIYEITGISDILRGASAASETATAQNIKNQWGTLRLKKMQKEVMRYCREALAIILEIAAKQFEPQTIQQMTGLPYLSEQQKAQIAFGLQQQAQQASFQAQMSGQPAPQPQPPDPQTQMLLQAPSWDQIVGLLRNDVARTYKTDIETNSTIDAEASQDKQDIAELLNALSQFFNGIAPLVEQGVMPMEIAKEILLIITRRYNFGSNIEDLLQNLQQPQQQQGPSAEQQAQQAQAESDKAIAAAKLSQTQAESAAATQRAQQDAQLAEQDFQHKMTLNAQEHAIASQTLNIKAAELKLQERAIMLKTAQQERAHEIKMAELAASKKEKAD